MAQHDYVIDNQAFPATRADINSVLQAIVSNNSGSSAPSTTFANQIWYDSSANILYIRNEDNDANIPLLQLDQSGDVAATLATIIDVLDKSGTNTAGTDLTIRAGAGTGTGAGGKIILQTADGGSSGSSVNSHATAVTILDDGKTGILETAPTVPLEVKGAQAFGSSASNLSTSTTKAATKIRGSSDASTALFFGSLTNDAEQYIQSANGAGSAADDLALNPFGGNVGIGLVSPDTPLEVQIGSSGNALKLSSDTDGASVFLAFEQQESGTKHVRGRIRAASSGVEGGLIFETGASSSTSEVMRLTNAGNLAVGTTGDSGKLFVNQTGTSSSVSFIYANNTSYTGVAHRTRCKRTASSSYYLYWGESDNGSDVEFYVQGNGNVRADGTIAGGGADYAEMFEWDDGNSSNEDRRGFSVVLTNGNKIRKATSSDAAADIIGVVSANPTVLGDAEPMKWSGKYNTDDFGNYIMETYTLTEWTEPAVYEDVQIDAVLDEDGNEIEPARTEQREVTEAVEHSYETDKIPSDLTVPSDAVVSSADGDGNTLKRRQLNPSYDDTQTYTPREERQEWDAIGLMGKLRMRTGQPTGDRWIKMRDITSDIEEWLVR